MDSLWWIVKKVVWAGKLGRLRDTGGGGVGAMGIVAIEDEGVGGSGGDAIGDGGLLL